MNKLTYIFVVIIVIIIILYYITTDNKTDAETISHNDNVTENEENQHNLFNIDKHIQDYNLFINDIDKNQEQLNTLYNNSVSLDEKKNILNKTKNYLMKTITGKMFDFWYGTKWSFNGITEKPRSGEIACGYFITTVLQHAGFNLERFRLAQQPSSLIIRTLCYKKSIKTYNNLNNLKEYLNNNSNSLYILGLDNHVGFVHKNEDEIYFTHSSYTGGRQVIRESLINSLAVKTSKVYMIGNLLDNVSILVKWLNMSKIPSLTH